MSTFRSNLLILVLIFSLNSLGQSKKLWMDAGDKAFSQRDYATAISLYSKVLNDTVVLKNSGVIPYATQVVSLKMKSENSKKAAEDTLKPLPADSSASKVVIENKRTNVDLKKTAPADYVLLQLGHAYRLNSDDQNALITYKKCIDRNIPDARYFYALTLMNVKRYQDALKNFEQYVNSGNASDSLAMQAQKKEAGCILGLDSLKISRELVIAQFDTTVFNKGATSFGTSYYPGTSKVIFTSARRGGMVVDPKKDDSYYLCDLYWSDFKDSSWTKAANFGPPVNSGVHEGAPFMTDKALYYTKWSDENPNETAIYKSNNQNGRFFVPQKLNQNVNLSGYKSMHPFVTADGKKLFYSSNRPGGKGGMDIWMCTLDESGMVGEPKNLGSPVNTAGDEVTPFLHYLSSTLYFSSNNLMGLGGLDVFKSEYNADEEVFGLPKNLGKPINSSKDDAYFIMERGGAGGFFSSDREFCEGGNCYKLFEFKSLPVSFDINGTVFDFATNKPLDRALVRIKNVHNEADVIFVMTDENGKYFAELQPNSEYFIKAQKNKYFGDAASHSTKSKVVTTHFEQDFFLNIIPAGEIEIQGIEYDFNSANLRQVSMASLDKIVDLLNLNDNLTVDIEANTDSRGNDSYNMKLSQARAQSCVDYLVSKGVARNRLKSKGNGETKPLITDEEINKLVPKSPEWEAAHQKNRRTALRIVGESQINIINKGK
jgi:OmpA-OmpF porin, OOP family